MYTGLTFFWGGGALGVVIIAGMLLRYPVNISVESRGPDFFIKEIVQI